MCQKSSSVDAGKRVALVDVDHKNPSWCKQKVVLTNARKKNVVDISQ